jgi:hypothetical protein
MRRAGILALLVIGLTPGCEGSLAIPDVDYRTQGDPAVCAYGPWSEHCPTAFWVRDVISAAQQDVDGDTGSALETNGVAIWAGESDGPQKGIPEGLQEAGEMNGITIYGDGVRLAWHIHTLIVWTSSSSTNLGEIGLDDIAGLVDASTKVPYP